MNYGHLIFESYKTNSDPEKRMINIDLTGNGPKTIILDYNDILYSKYKTYSFYDVLNVLPNDLEKFNESDIAKVNKIKNMESIGEMNDAIRNFTEYQYKTKLFSLHLDLAKKINETNKKRNIVNLVDFQSTIMSGATAKGQRLTTSELNKIFIQKKEYFQKDDLMRLLSLIRYYNPDNDINELSQKLSDKINISENDLKLIEHFSVERSCIDEEVMNRINKAIIFFRNKHKYNKNEETVHKNDKRYLCVKESKLTTFCDMCCKNELPEEDFQYIERPKIFNNNKNNKMYKANTLIENQNLDEESKISLNIDNLILFNVGGLSTFEIASLEKAIKNKQYNMNIIYGSNQIYNHEEYIKYIKEYFKGNNGIVKDNVNTVQNIKMEMSDEDNDSREVINTGHNTIEFLNRESNEQKINVNLFNNKNSYINNDKNNVKRSTINTMSYDAGPISNSIIKQSHNNRNTLDSDDVYSSDYK